MSDGNAILTVEKLTKQFGRLTALRATSFDLARGEFLTVFGRNGAGKSTLLKIVSTLIRSYQGTVTLFGEDLKRASESVRRRIGFVSHDSFMYQDLTVSDNLRFYARLYDLDRAAERVRRAIEDVGLDAKAHTHARALSRGMRQRLAIARAFLHEPRLVLLDEPFTGLDEQAAALLNERLRAYLEGGGSAIMATHHIERGWRHAMRVAVLDRGGLVYEARTEDTTMKEFAQHYEDILSH